MWKDQLLKTSGLQFDKWFSGPENVLGPFEKQVPEQVITKNFRETGPTPLIVRTRLVFLRLTFLPIIIDSSLCSRVWGRLWGCRLWPTSLLRSWWGGRDFCRLHKHNVGKSVLYIHSVYRHASQTSSQERVLSKFSLIPPYNQPSFHEWVWNKREARDTCRQFQAVTFIHSENGTPLTITERHVVKFEVKRSELHLQRHEAVFICLTHWG